MLKIAIKEDCGNAPKKLFIKDFNIAFAEKNIEAILNSLDDSIEWVMVGGKTMHGKEEVKASMTEMLAGDATELVVESIISHGDKCASNGSMKFTDGSSIFFCDIYEFTGHAKTAKIKRVTSYGVEA